MSGVYDEDGECGKSGERKGRGKSEEDEDGDENGQAKGRMADDGD